MVLPVLFAAQISNLPPEYRDTVYIGNNTWAHSFMVPMRNSSVLLDTIAFTNNPDLLLSYSNSSVTPHRVVLNRTPYDIWWFQEFSEAYV